LRVFRRRGFYLGLLHVLHVKSRTIQPEWAWSHTGDNWSRTHTPCIPFGDESSFDTRLILCGDVTQTDDELICVYRGSNQRHDGSLNRDVPTTVGRATLPLEELDAWLDSLPQP
jgi:hypothetical protein